MVDTKSPTSVLIPFATRQLGTDTVQTVNAQDIHAFLEVKTRFDQWIERRIETYGFQEGRDFTTVNFDQGPIRTIEYHVSIGMAKELSMVERTKRGKEARQYFLECERLAQTPAALPKLHDPAYQMLIQAVVDLDTTRHELAQVNAKADLALNNQQWLTVREYVYLRKLERQMPPSLCKAFGTYLTGYCVENGIPVRDQGIVGQQWGKENAYHVEVIEKLLSVWLLRRHGQQPLRVVAEEG